MNTNYKAYRPAIKNRFNWAWWWYIYTHIGVLGEET